MIFTINSRDHGAISFWMSGDAGYVFLESEGKPGSLGSQICRGGGFSGSTITANAENFERICRNWWRLHLKQINEINGYS